MDADKVIECLRTRAADPARRRDAVPWPPEGGSLSLDVLGARVQMTGSDLMRMVESNRQGRPPDPALVRLAESVAAAMGSPQTPTAAPDPADPAAVDDAERALGVTLPPLLRRVYVEVADGGVGPEQGLLPLAAIVEQYRDLRHQASQVEDDEWPQGLVPVVRTDEGGYLAVRGDGSMVEATYEEREVAGDVLFGLVLRNLPYPVDRWLADWAGG